MLHEVRSSVGSMDQGGRTIGAEERRLLDAVIEAPDDDAPRLVYADWLQHHGDPRGELIQLQCQLAAVPDDDRRRQIRIAENKLLEAHAEEWTRPLHALLPAASHFHRNTFTFVRGFVEEVTLGLSALPHLAALAEAAPLLRRLKLVSDGVLGAPIPRPHLAGALASPVFRQLRRLELALPGGGNRLALDVAAAPTLGELRELRIAASVSAEQTMYFESPRVDLVLDDTGARALAGSPHLAKLERLDLTGNRLTIAGVRAIAAGPWRLRELLLAHNALDASGLLGAPEALARALDGPALASLEVLSLEGTTLAAPAVDELVRCPALAHLRELDLERCHIGPDGAAALCQSFALPALRRLRLERNHLCDAGAIALAGCAALAGLTSLEAGHNRIGQKGGTAIATSPHFTGLERLTLNEPRWKPEMTALFAGSPTLAKARIYLGGRLVARKKVRATEGAASEPLAPAEAAPSAARSKPRARASSQGPVASKPGRGSRARKA